MLILILSAEQAIVITVGVVCAWLLTLALAFAFVTRSDALKSRGEAAERSDQEESFDLSVDEAILLTHEAVDVEEFEEDVDLIARLEIEFRADRTVQRLANKLGGK